VGERFGNHTPLRLLLQPVVSDRRRRRQALLDVALLQQLS
jgi:hypothetical protein